MSDWSSKHMDILKQIEEILAQRKPHEKSHQLEQLSDAFEYGFHESEMVIAEGVQLLLTFALQEKEYDVQEACFFAINNAIVYSQEKKVGSRVDWDTLVAALPSLEKPLQSYVFNILSLSMREKYVRVCDEYAHHSDLEVRTWAQEARDDLRAEIQLASGAFPHIGKGKEVQ